MPRKFCQIVVFLLLGMAFLSPFLQMNSMDEFPIKGDDFEIWVICGLCGIGIVLLLSEILKIVPSWSSFRLPATESSSHGPAVDCFSSENASFPLVVPLRI
jgi:hypothetical protein